jgi:glycosyltransferase involved in cell wall biosynthesis
MPTSSMCHDIRAQVGQVPVIIPTKNRPDHLTLAVRSVLAQTVVPLSLVIIDQSSNDEGRRQVECELRLAENRQICVPNLKYVADPSISGLVMARNRAMTIADGDTWLFLDDDVVLKRDFVALLVASCVSYS